MMRRRILVIDDMEFNRHHLRKVLESDDLEVDTAGDGRSAWERLKVQKYHLVITDLRMPDVGGLELLARVRSEKMPLGVIVLTAFGDPEEALRAMKAGADDFVSKPYEPDRLRLLVKRILERRELIDELERLRKQMRGDYPFHNMVSKSPKIRRVFDLIEQVGPLGSTVVIHGETGTGKELIAQALHTADTDALGPIHRAQLRGAERIASGKRALRPRERGLYRRGEAKDRAIRAGERRHVASGRDRRPGSEPSGQVVAGVADGRVRAGRRHREFEGRRPDRRRHAPRPGRRGQEGAIPRRFVLPFECDPHRASSVA